MANVTDDFQDHLDMAVVRAITILDQSLGVASSAAANPTAPRAFGNDIIVGGADDDEAFGGLGDDIIQGDGRFVLLAGAQPRPCGWHSASAAAGAELQCPGHYGGRDLAPSPPGSRSWKAPRTATTTSRAMAATTASTAISVPTI